MADQTFPTKRIVIVEDSTSLSEIYKTRLEMLGYTCFIAYNGITGLYFIQKELPDLVLLDLMVPDIAGDQILLRMRSSKWGKNIPVFIVSNLNEADAPEGLRELGIEGYAVKANLSGDQIDQIVNNILRREGGVEPAPNNAADPNAPAMSEVVETPAVAQEPTPPTEAPGQPTPPPTEPTAFGG